MGRLLSIYLGICLLLPACVSAKAPASEEEHQASPTPTATANVALISLQIAEQTVQVELACTDAEQQKGLMFRKEMPADQGMLFVFERERSLSFWMKNTYLPLSIAYIDAVGQIVDIQDMQPLDETPHVSAAPARYALEMNQGWFQRHQIQVGARILLDSFCPQP